MPQRPPAPERNLQPDDDIIPTDAASASFVRALIARGQAAKTDASGVLPRGATHEIIGETDAGLPILRRRRFSRER